MGPPATLALSTFPFVTAHRTRQAQIVAQGRALVLGPEQPTRLQFRNDEIDEIVEPARERRGLDQEPVDAVAVESGLHLVGDHRGGADHRALAAGAGEALVELADGQLLVARPADDLPEGGLPGVGAVALHRVGKRAVDVVAAQVELAEALGEHFDPHVGMDQGLEMGVLLPRLRLGAADDGIEAGHHLQMLGLTSLASPRRRRAPRG